jgi:RNA polymerase sigma factor (sigma-70 family)
LARFNWPAACLVVTAPCKPQQGDEARLFLEFNEMLISRVSRTVFTSPEVVEDACATAWTKFLIHQPDRQQSWKGWLFRTAEREAWRLDRMRYAALAIDPAEASSHPAAINEPPDPTNPIELRTDLNDAVGILEELSPRLRRIAFLRASGLRYRDIGEITGDSPTRVNQLVADANRRIHAALGRLREADQAVPPRAKRLRDLEESPPAWLTAELGRPPRADNRRESRAQRLLAWRRAALAIDDYRQLANFRAPGQGIGPRPTDLTATRAYDLAARAIEAVQRGQTVERGLG